DSGYCGPIFATGIIDQFREASKGGAAVFDPALLRRPRERVSDSQARQRPNRSAGKARVMHTLRSILLATDFHAPSQGAAIDAVVRLASALESRVTLFHVVEPLPAWPLSPQPARELATEPLGELAEELGRRGVTVAESSIGVGPAADTIVRR